VGIIRSEYGGVWMDRMNELISRATAARENAYCPYSGFAVGAAVLTADGRIYTGCNVENASYGLTNCAERTAVLKAVSEGAREIVAVAVVAEGEPPPPCGACRQVLAEFGPRAEVVLASTAGERIRTSVDALLPGAFRFKK